jgi:hypothetical protein
VFEEDLFQPLRRGPQEALAHIRLGIKESDLEHATKVAEIQI